MRLIIWCFIFSACSKSPNEVSLAHISTTPQGNIDLALGDSLQLTGTYFDKSGTAEAATLVWSSSNTSIILVRESGMAVSKGVGSVKVSAAFKDTKSDPIDFTVFKNENKVISVEIAVLKTTISVGEEISFSFIAKNIEGALIPGKVASWQSNELDVLIIGPASGIAVGQSPGPAVITARVEGVTSNAIEMTVVQ